MFLPFRYALVGWLVCAGAVAAQEAAPKLPEIADEPKAVDPATLMPAKLAEPATVDLSDSSLRELAEWLQNERKIAVLLGERALRDVGESADMPISERLNNAPLYFLLNRLHSFGLAWYFQDDVLHITTPEEAETGMTTTPYAVGDLLDAGYDMNDLELVFQGAIAPETWDDVGGSGALSFLGDVMFVRQTDAIQREVQGLLAALRKHGRRTYTFDPPQHQELRQKLGATVTVDFRNTPLKTAVEQLADQAKIDIRLDVRALDDVGIRERQPVTLKLSDRKLEMVLQALAANLELTWMLRDGILWITTSEEAETHLKTAVYDVRDLCRNDDESLALLEALTSQTNPESWDDVGGPGAMEFARPGVLVVSTVERIHDDVLNLLESYRAALRASRPRDRNAVDPQELTTVYYRLHAHVAEGLAGLLPQLVQPETWKSEAHPEARGTILLAASEPDTPNFGGAAPGKDAATLDALVTARAVLIIRQSRAAHQEIAEVIRRVQTGDAAEQSIGGGLGGFGGGGGGFGGGFF